MERLPEGVEFVAEEEGVREYRLANGLKLPAESRGAAFPQA